MKFTEEFTGVTFNDLDPTGLRFQGHRRSKFSVVSITEIELNIPHKAHIL